MELYTFGFDIDPRSQACDGDGTALPSSSLRAQNIRILWASWCDAVIAHEDDAGLWTVEYRGGGFTDAQTEHLISSQVIKRSCTDTSWKVDFFGTTMHDGLRGYVSYGPAYSENEVVLFGTDVEVENDIPGIKSFSVSGEEKIVAIRLASNGSVLVSMCSSNTGHSQIVHVKDLKELRDSLRTGFSESAGPRIGSSDCAQLCTNSTTVTLLDDNSQVYTATSDPRYPRCLGRPYASTADFESVPYLSETHVDRIASGGYLTAAVSIGGELFLWGQACPGAKGELTVLKYDASPNDGSASSTSSGITADDEQDDFVKYLTVVIDGQDAEVYDVAVGHGHVLVAAEVRTADECVTRAVFAAGNNSRGQLGSFKGPLYSSTFEEVTALRGKKVVELIAAGWSTYVIATEE